MEKNLPSDRRYCPNCHYPLEEGGKYCTHCSQKYTTGKITVWQFFHELFEAIFNVDSRIFRTFRDMFFPGKLTIAYFKGRHRRYVHPLRLFLVTSILGVATITFLGGDKMNDTIFNIDSRDHLLDSHRSIFLEDLDTVKQEVLVEYPNNQTVVSALDSLRKKMAEDTRDSTEVPFLEMKGPYSFNVTTFKVAEKDLTTLSPREIPEKYGIEGFASKLIAKQWVKILLQSGGFSRFILGKAIWMSALMMLALALILKIFYIRRKRYYVEHLIFSFHYHSFAFVLFSASLLADYYFFKGPNNFEPGGFTIAAVVITAIYLFVAMIRVYRQSFVKTFIKYHALNFFYLIIFLVFLALTIVVSGLMF